MSLKCTTADSKSNQHKSHTPQTRFVVGAGVKKWRAGWRGGDGLPPPKQTRPRTHTAAHTQRHQGQQKLIKLAGQPQRPPLCAHRAKLSTETRPAKNEEEKKQNPGGLKMHNEGGAAGCYHTNGQVGRYHNRPTQTRAQAYTRGGAASRCKKQPRCCRRIASCAWASRGDGLLSEV